MLRRSTPGGTALMASSTDMSSPNCGSGVSLLSVTLFDDESSSLGSDRSLWLEDETLVSLSSPPSDDGEFAERSLPPQPEANAQNRTRLQDRRIMAVRLYSSVSRGSLF